MWIRRFALLNAIAESGVLIQAARFMLLGG